MAHESADNLAGLEAEADAERALDGGDGHLVLVGVGGDLEEVVG